MRRNMGCAVWSSHCFEVLPFNQPDAFHGCFAKAHEIPNLVK